MHPFKRGMEKIVEGLDVPIAPIHLGGLWGSIFSFEGGGFFWKWPRRVRYPVTISFGDCHGAIVESKRCPRGRAEPRRV